MNDHRALLVQSAEAAFAAAAAGRTFAESWDIIEKAGFVSLMVCESAGGFGGRWSDLLSIMHIAGRHALPLPLGEAIMAAELLSAHGLDWQDTIPLIAPHADGEIAQQKFSGVIHAVPWGNESRCVLAAVDNQLCRIDMSGAAQIAISTAADEPRISYNCVRAPVTGIGDNIDIMAQYALIRSAQMTGAMERCLELTIEHVQTRQQFGRSLSKLQAVQQAVALLAEEVAAATAATAGSGRAADRDIATIQFEAAATKIRVNRAARTAIEIAHQMHGAIGFTREYLLQRYTRRLMSWRSEAGSDAYWAPILGRMVASLGGPGLWKEITRRTDKY